MTTEQICNKIRTWAEAYEDNASHSSAEYDPSTHARQVREVMSFIVTLDKMHTDAHANAARMAQQIHPNQPTKPQEQKA